MFYYTPIVGSSNGLWQSFQPAVVDRYGTTNRQVPVIQVGHPESLAQSSAYMPLSAPLANRTLIYQPSATQREIATYTVKRRKVTVHPDADEKKCKPLSIFSLKYGYDVTFTDGTLDVINTKISNERLQQIFNDYKPFGITKLSLLYCENITRLDLSVLSSLTSLYCYNCENLTELNLYNLTNLLHLNCSNTNIATLDLRFSPNLEMLSCSGCQKLEQLNLRNLNNLTYVNCSSCIMLESLSACLLNKLTTLYCENCKKLTNLDVQLLSNLENFGFSRCGKLLNLRLCWLPKIESLNFSGLINLERLDCLYCRKIKKFDLRDCEKLHTFAEDSDSREIILHPNAPYSQRATQ